MVSGYSGWMETRNGGTQESVSERKKGLVGVTVSMIKEVSISGLVPVVTAGVSGFSGCLSRLIVRYRWYGRMTQLRPKWSSTTVPERPVNLRIPSDLYRFFVV